MNDAGAQSDLQPTATPEIPMVEISTAEIPMAEISTPETPKPEFPASEIPNPEIPTPEFPPRAPAKAPELSGIELRLKQISEYRENACQYRNRLTANIRRADSDLMEVAALVADRLREVLKSGPQTEDLAEQTVGSADLLLRVSDHIEKFADLEMRLNKEDKLADPFRLF
jgi:hypothetical protein